jgi:hypothetical protein
MKASKFWITFFSFFIIIFAFNTALTQNNGFDPLDPLGPEYGKINQPRLESKSFEAFEGDKLEDPEINFPDYKNQNTTSNNQNNINATNPSKRERYEQISQNMEEQARDAMRSNQDNNEYAKIQTYDAEAYNYERFANSPCFDKIGFSPTWDMESLENQYSDCESENNLKKTMDVLYIFIFILIFALVIFYSLPKDKREVLISKLPKLK